VCAFSLNMNTESKTTPPRLDRISDYPAFHAARTPGAEALSGVGGDYTYRAFSAAVDSVASSMLSRGICAGDVVATLAPPRGEFFIIFLATARIGAVWLGLNPKSTARELGHILEDAKPSLVFCINATHERDSRSELEALGIDPNQIVIMDDPDSFAAFRREGEGGDPGRLRLAVDAVRPEDPALIIYTSGTTGSPKGALLSQGGMARSFHTQACVADVRDVRILNNLPINHIGSVGDVSCHALICGGLVHFMDVFDAAGSLKAIEARRLTVWGQVPAQLQQSLESETAGHHDLSSLQLIFWSGGVAPAPLVKRLLDLGPRLLNAYGMTEATSNVTYTPFGSSASDLSETVGVAAPDCEVRIVDGNGRELPVGREGEVCIRTDRLMVGYLNNDGATREAVSPDGWLRTGDAGMIGEDGLLRLTGRKKEMFKSGGYNVYPREIEQVLEAVPGVRVAVVVAAPHPVFGESGVAYITQAPGANISEKMLRDWCRENLANYKIPKSFRIRETLPVLAIGKIDKVALQKDAEMAFSGS
jgi:acyl-CoA synthetase (AMP-forming)/AMP-acid ligase II